MIPITREVEVIKSETPKVKFTMEVSHRNMHLLIPLLRDSLYSNKKLAPLREYSTNAYDAHVEAGIPSRPIQVTLPTVLEPELRIRDFGHGLSILDMSEIYFKYLESTKRESNDLNGMLGLGSKSAFAYADLFVVTSFKDGKKRIVTCPISGEPTLDYEGDTTEENGIEICIPVKREDVDAFVQNALNFYKYWTVRPTIIGVLKSKMDEYFNPIDVKAIFFGDKWTVRPAAYGKDEAVCVMGNVPYPIDWDQVKSLIRGGRAEKLKQIWSFIESNIVELRLDIGSIDFTPNREALQYTDHTLKGIAEVLCEIYDRIFDLITEKISKASNLWEAMIIYNQLFHGQRLGGDTEKDTLFAGDMTAIKNMLQNRLKWNGIVINEGNFDELQHWDADFGCIDYNNDNWSHRRRASENPVLITYTRGDSQTKSVHGKKPHRWHGSNIVPSKTAVVVVHDIDKAKCVGAAARYILWEKHQDINHVYFLRLSNSKVRKAFYEKYNFDSVPVIYVSDIQDKVKAWTKKNRKAVTSTGARSPITVPCVNLDYYVDHDYYGRSADWSQEAVRISDIKKGVFVLYDRGNIELSNGRRIESDSAGPLLRSYVEYCKFFNIKPGKVYGIHRRTVNSKWFKDEIRCKNWVYLDTIVSNGMVKADKEGIKKSFAFFDQISALGGQYIGTILAKKLLPTITDANSPMVEYCKDITDGVATYRPLFSVIQHFELEGFQLTKDKSKTTHSYKDKAANIRKLYPLIFKMNNSSVVSNCDPKENYYKLNVDDFQDIVDYINSMDVVRSQSQKSNLTTASK